MARIEAGVDPWIAYRDFVEDWTYIPSARAEIANAAPRRTKVSALLPWAALLAATVEALCERDNLPAPEWIFDPAFHLAEPWYLYDGTGRIRDWLRETTPIEFASRNIWSGNRLLNRV
jgi:hypothetical protein